jgi:hypothetical protein
MAATNAAGAVSEDVADVADAVDADAVDADGGRDAAVGDSWLKSDDARMLLMLLMLMLML